MKYYNFFLITKKIYILIRDKVKTENTEMRIISERF